MAVAKCRDGWPLASSTPPTLPGQTLAHELGHNLGRRHTCGCGEDGCVDQHPGGVIGVYGVDLENPSAPVYLDPNTTFDIMTYRSPKWISDITYEALWDSFRPAAAETQRGFENPPGLEEREYLVGSGYIVNRLVTMTRPFYRLPSPPGASDEQGQGQYMLELLDASGGPLFTRYFDTAGDTSDPVEGSGHFRQVVPWQEGTARIVIKEGQTVLHITHISANPPEVTLLSPNGGEYWLPYGEHTVTWTGSDADGDPLRYILQYSPDGGSTWKTVATNLTGESYTLEAGRLAGSETALLRVFASDGVNTGQGQSDATFTVEGKPPEAADA